MIDQQCSISQACKIVGLSRSSYQYKHKTKDDSDIQDALTAVVSKHPAIGFWQSYYRFRNKGKCWNHQRVRRVYRQMKEGDPEVKQINGMLEKIIDIQHPERLKERLQDKQTKAGVFQLQHYQAPMQGFFSPDSIGVEAISYPAIEAVVADNQVLVNGATMKLRMVLPTSIGIVQLPKDVLVYGTVSLNGERLFITITSIRHLSTLLPVALTTYDLDGMEGIYIPGAITRDVSKQSADNALQTLALNSFDPSLGAQAASAGIETAKQLVSKKVKLVRVAVKAGYRVLLKDKKN